MNSHSIAYTEKDVSKDASAQQEMARLGARGVPTFLIGDEVIIGFDKERILKSIGTKVIECPECRSKMRIPTDKGLILVTCKKCDKQFKVNS